MNVNAMTTTARVNSAARGPMEVGASRVKFSAAGGATSQADLQIANKLPLAGSLGAAKAFTLIELLIVISIIGVLSAFGIAAMIGVVKNKYISTANAEMALIQAGLERYKAAYGVYPPSNPNFSLPRTDPNFSIVNPLLFELSGVTFNNGVYTTMDGANSVSTNKILASFGVAGFINCSKGSAEDGVAAKVFLPGLKANQIGMVTNPAGSGNPAVAILKTSVGGPDLKYQPLGAVDLNPWRYNSINPTNNPGSYDLYVQLVINGKTNLVCNWSKQVQINRPLP